MAFNDLTFSKCWFETCKGIFDDKKSNMEDDIEFEENDFSFEHLVRSCKKKAYFFSVTL